MADVVGVGFNTEDHVTVTSCRPSIGDKVRLGRYFRHPGGQVPTALVALRRWGLSAAYIGPLGDDEGGRAQLESLRNEGVDTDGCRLCPGVPSQCSFIAIDERSGERTIHWYRDDRLRISAEQVDASRIAGARAVLLDGEDLALALAVAHIARGAGAIVMLDLDSAGPQTRRLLELTDIAVVPDGFLQSFAPASERTAALRAILDCGPTIAAVTLGADGVIAYRDDRLYRQAAFSVRAVDTTSAGDVFHAAFLYARLNDDDMDETLRFAAAAASLACATMGGRGSIPDLAAIRARMAGAMGSH